MSSSQRRYTNPEQHALFQRLGSIFTPYGQMQRESFFGGSPTQETEARFVHYTTAESALNMISTKQLWMRNTNCMSDYSEVQHGQEIFQRYFGNSARQEAFIGAVEEFLPGTAGPAIEFLKRQFDDIRLNTYISSVSEHDEKEDMYGRLSMWRAFGGVAGRVAVVFKVPWDFAAPLALNLYLTPVSYLPETATHRMLDEAVAKIRDNKEFLRTVDPLMLRTFVYTIFVAGVLSLKHEGFREEREWRFVYWPRLAPSTLMRGSVEVIGGIPQHVYKIPLDSGASPMLHDLDLRVSLDRLIIGPSAFPRPMHDAFVDTLTKAGVAEAEKKVFISNIPIRT
jgi:hypothetical protein